MFINIYLVNNEITTSGCMHLIKAEWKRLIQLNLSIKIIYRRIQLH